MRPDPSGKPRGVALMEMETLVTSVMDRRRFLLASLAGFLAPPVAAGAQQARKTPRIGILWNYSPAGASAFAAAFRQGLGTLGYVEGQTILLEERWTGGKLDRLTPLATELIRLNVDVLVTTTTPAARAAQQATRT